MKASNTAIARRQQVEKRERIQRIMNAGRKLFLERGYLETKIRDIALDAELSPGLIYFYFKTKDEIYGNIIKEGFHIQLDKFRKASKTEGTGIERMIALGMAHLAFYEEHGDYFNIMSFKNMGFKKVGLPEKQEEELNQLSYEALSIVNEVSKQIISEHNLPPDTNSWKLTLALWGMTEGAISIHQRGYCDTYGQQLEEVIKLQIQMTLGGLK